MICQFVCEAVIGHDVIDDGRAVKVKFLSGEDQVNLIVPVPDLDNLIDKLTAARDAAAASGIERSAAFQMRIPKTVAAGALQERPGTVAQVFDRSLPSRIGFVLTAGAARTVGHQLIEAAREAERQHTIAMAEPADRLQG